MRYALLGIAVCGFVSLWGVGPAYVPLAAFVVMFVNFATFCLLYERPNARARFRVAAQLQHMHPNSEMAQRLSIAPIRPTAAERKLGFGPMTMLNLATGVTAAGLFVWGIGLRIF